MLPAPQQASAQIGQVGQVTELALPRFVSLKASRARLRSGPGTQYPIKWVYVAPNIPLEIVAEYDGWRKVRDWTSAQGWMHHALLSGRRTAIVSPWRDGLTYLREAASPDADVLANVEDGVLVDIGSCNGVWCNVVIDRLRLEGFIKQAVLWGVYPDETYR